MKRYLFKVYKPNGNYITTWNDATFDGFRMQINGGLGECNVKLARKFDDFGEDVDVKLNNKVEIWLHDKDTTPEGLKIYSGYISAYAPFIDGHNEGVGVTLMGYVSKLATAILKNGSTIAITYSSTDPSQMVRNIIDRYRAECVNPQINYSSTSIYNTGQSNTYEFQALTYAEALDKCLGMAPANYWWFIGADNILWFHPKDTKPKHRFIFGRHFKKVEVFKNMEKVVNRVLFNSTPEEGSHILKLYSDTDSSDKYDDRWEIVSDSRVRLEETADSIANSELNEKKDADITTKAEIIDNNESEFGYDIESIKPGDTCSFLGFSDITSRTFEDVMLIKAVDYSLDKVSIEVESLYESLARELEKNKIRLQQQELSDIPDSYPTVTIGWKSWTPTFYKSDGTTQTTPSFCEAKYTQIGKTVTGNVRASGLTNNGGSTFYVTLPVTAKSYSGNREVGTGAGYNGSGTYVSRMYITYTDSTKGCVTIHCGTNGAEGNWSNTGNNILDIHFTYEAE